MNKQRGFFTFVSLVVCIFAAMFLMIILSVEVDSSSEQSQQQPSQEQQISQEQKALQKAYNSARNTSKQKVFKNKDHRIEGVYSSTNTSGGLAYKVVFAPYPQICQRHHKASEHWTCTNYSEATAGQCAFYDEHFANVVEAFGAENIAKQYEQATNCGAGNTASNELVAEQAAKLVAAEAAAKELQVQLQAAQTKLADASQRATDAELSVKGKEAEIAAAVANAQTAHAAEVQALQNQLAEAEGKLAALRSVLGNASSATTQVDTPAVTVDATPNAGTVVTEETSSTTTHAVVEPLSPPQP